MRKILAILFALIMSFETKAQSSENLQKIETYLNNLKSLEATFVQMASNGATAEGRLFIKKPNKIRMEYAEPTNVLIVGDGNFIIYNDLDLDQVTHIDYNDIPASLILSDKIKIDGNCSILTKRGETPEYSSNCYAPTKISKCYIGQELGCDFHQW